MGGDGNDIVLTYESVLPVELISFGARILKDDVQLHWATASEINNDFFTIERSKDGRSFQAVSTINGHGNSSHLIEYSFVDKNPLKGTNYYRLKQTDFDGNFTYSDIKSVNISIEHSFTIYPTLVRDKINIRTESDFDTDLTVKIRDLNGRVLKHFTISKNENLKEIYLEDLIYGNYFITISDDQTLNTFRFIKL